MGRQPWVSRPGVYTCVLHFNNLESVFIIGAEFSGRSAFMSALTSVSIAMAGSNIGRADNSPGGYSCILHFNNLESVVIIGAEFSGMSEFMSALTSVSITIAVSHIGRADNVTCLFVVCLCCQSRTLWRVCLLRSHDRPCSEH